MKKILVVDDELSFQEPVARFFEIKGYKTLTADSGKEALKKIKIFRPELVITDIRMPEMDGVALFLRIKKQNPDIQVMLMTAYSNIDTAVQTMKNGAADYISKPFDNNELLARVHSVFKKEALNRKLEDYELLATVSRRTLNLNIVGANLAHQLNNLLHPFFLTFSSLVELAEAIFSFKKPEDPENSSFPKINIDHVINMSRIGRLSYKKIKTKIELWTNFINGNPDQQSGAISLTACVNTAMELVEQPLYNGNKIFCDLGEERPEVRGNMNEITRLIINLLLNAAFATEKQSQAKNYFQKQINLGVSSDEKRVIFTVSDNGIGMDKEMLARIGKQLSSSKKIFSISQKGLYDAFGIAKKYGAKIFVRSNGPGQGSTFVVSFPRAI